MTSFIHRMSMCKWKHIHEEDEENKHLLDQGCGVNIHLCRSIDTNFSSWKWKDVCHRRYKTLSGQQVLPRLERSDTTECKQRQAKTTFSWNPPVENNKEPHRLHGWPSIIFIIVWPTAAPCIGYQIITRLKNNGNTI